jgi:hypothetical protein
LLWPSDADPSPNADTNAGPNADPNPNTALTTHQLLDSYASADGC